MIQLWKTPLNKFLIKQRAVIYFDEEFMMKTSLFKTCRIISQAEWRIPQSGQSELRL